MVVPPLVWSKLDEAIVVAVAVAERLLVAVAW